MNSSGDEAEVGRLETSPMVKNKRRNLKRILSRYHFESDDLERLYKRYVYKLQQSAIGYLLGVFILLTLCLSILKFVYVWNFTVSGIYLAIQCFTFIGIFIFLHTKYMNETHFRVINYFLLAFLLCFAVLSFPFYLGPSYPGISVPVYTPADGVWEVLFVVFIVYSLMPLRTYVAVVFGMLLPISHLLVSAFVTDQSQPSKEYFWRQVKFPFLFLCP